MKHQNKNITANQPDSALSKERTEYNGHPSYKHWNTALWFGGDEGLYHILMESESPASFIRECKSLGLTRTPDGVYLSKKLLMYAWECFESDRTINNN
jgi:hypothetical protein